MDKEIEKLIKKIALRDVKLAILNRREKAVVITESAMDEILKEIEKEYDNK